MLAARWGIDLSHRAGRLARVVQVIEANNVRGTLALRLAQVAHGLHTVGVQVVFDDRSNDWVVGTEKHLWKPCLTRQIGAILRENSPLYGRLTARAISSPPNERNRNDHL